MLLRSQLGRIPVTLAALFWMVLPAAGQTLVPAPREEFGFSPGDDYHLANYTQLVEYWKKVEASSDRLRMVSIGETAEGRTLWMAIITSGTNQARLARFQEIARLLARARVEPDEARELAREGRSVVWIDGGLHASETLGAQQLIELVHQMASRTDPETLRILDDVILLVVCSNPDGLDLVADWYMRESVPGRRSTRNLPRLYQKYVGHDNNRDFYMSTQPETQAINRILYREWFPQIVFNHHQTGPSGTVLFAPPFRDPFNYHIDPLVITTLDLVGAAMHSRLAAEGKRGATMRNGASYSTWWNGGLRTTPYFHNMIGLLTETIGHPTPIKIPFRPERQLPSGNLPLPIEPQVWHFRQSVEYSMTANRAVLDIASRHREQLLHNIYRMGKNSIDRGSRDTWTPQPGDIERARAALEDRRKSGLPASEAEEEIYERFLRDPQRRDPRAYILSSDQSDFLTAVKFANTLVQTGIEWHRATAEFRAGDRSYPAGSLIARAAQAFRPHLLDMFEPQDHPNNLLDPTEHPVAPYDSSGWTLALQMGIEFDRVLEPLEGPFREVDGRLGTPEGRIEGPTGGPGFLFSHALNDSFLVVNRLLASGREVYWLQGGSHEFYVRNQAGTAAQVADLARETGVNFQRPAMAPKGEALRLRQPRIALWDEFGGSISSGWMRWVFEQWEFPFRLVFPSELDRGHLEREFDVLVFVSGSIPGDWAGTERKQPSPKADEVPAEFRGRLGAVTVKKTIPHLRRFLEKGGTILTIGSSTVLAEHLGLPLSNPLLETSGEGKKKPLSPQEFYIPGSVLRMEVDNEHPLAHGMKPFADVFFRNSPVFRVGSGDRHGGRAVGWFGSRPLRSGWAWGQERLRDAIAVMEWPVGRGRLLLYGPEVMFRSQPHGTYKLVFNGIHYGTADRVTLDFPAEEPQAPGAERAVENRGRGRPGRLPVLPEEPALR